MPHLVTHDRLAAEILASDATLVLVTGLPATGKSALLRAVAARARVPLRTSLEQAAADDLAVVDLDEARLHHLPPPRRRAVIAAPPGALPVLTEGRLRSDVRVIGNRELFLPPDDDPAFERSAGWPILSGYFSGENSDPAEAVAYLRDVLRTRLDDSERDILLALCAAEEGLRAENLPEDARVALRALEPLVEARGDRWRFRTAGVADLLRQAARDMLPGRKAARWLEAGGAVRQAISAAIAGGHRRLAHEMLARHGGMFLTHLLGTEAARAILAAFGEDPHPEVVALSVMVEVKSGDVERANYLLTRGGSSDLTHLERPLAEPDAVPRALLLCRLLMGIYRNMPGASTMMSESAIMLRRLDGKAHLWRGAVYNTVLEVHLRAGAYAEAEETAARALFHYEAAGAPYLAFYIHVHRVVIHLMCGRPGRAGVPLEAAERALEETPFDTPQDERFLSLLRAVIAYEQGDPEPMARFAEGAFRDFAHGEIWPTIAAQALAHGAEALLHLRGLEPALTYLDSWRVQAWKTRRFRVLIEQREVATLQAARRWREARGQLEAMATRIGRVWMDSSGENLADLRAPEDLFQAMLWLRQQAFETRRDRGLARRIEAFARNPRLSWRDQRCLRLWLAWVERRQGRVSAARRHLADTLEACAAQNCSAPVLEERVFVLPLLEDRRMTGGPMAGAPIPRNLRRGAAKPFGADPLSRQEWRALLLLVEGCSNKEIAREMRISLPTVKFHLKNLYAKLGVGHRRDAVEAAREREMIDA